jgi:hypothetical protein
MSLLFIRSGIQADGNRYVAEGNISVVSGFVFSPVCLTLFNESLPLFRIANPAKYYANYFTAISILK